MPSPVFVLRHRIGRFVALGVALGALLVGVGLSVVPAAASGVSVASKTAGMGLDSGSWSDAEAAAPGGRYSRLVREIQLRLTALGAYRGRVGGVLTAATQDAIQAYQKVFELAPDGKPSWDLLRRLTGATQAADRLLLVLETERRGQLATARAALARTFGPDWAAGAPARIGVSACAAHSLCSPVRRRCSHCN